MYGASSRRALCELLSVSHISNGQISLAALASPGTFLAQVPWLGVYISYIPFAVKSLNTMLMHGQTNAMRRLQRGSTTRDLFHYLVRLSTMSLSLLRTDFPG